MSDLSPLQSIIAECSERYNCRVAFSSNDLDKDKSVCISEIVSREPGNGNGTSCLRYIIEQLKAIGCRNVNIVVFPLQQKITTKQHNALCRRLVGWYEREGFELVSVNYNDGNMISADMEMRI